VVSILAVFVVEQFSKGYINMWSSPKLHHAVITTVSISVPGLDPDLPSIKSKNNKKNFDFYFYTVVTS
jgi:hypothetical protein